MNEYRWVKLTELGKIAAANLRGDARHELWRMFNIENPTPDEIDDILNLASMTVHGEYFEPLELGHSMTLEESGWKPWVELGIVELE